MMFQKFAEVQGFDKGHHFFQCGFRKITGANFNVMDIRLFIEFTVYSTITSWQTHFGILCIPYFKIEYATHHCGFNGWYMETVTDLEELTCVHLMRMKSQRPFQQVYIRMYYR